MTSTPEEIRHLMQEARGEQEPGECAGYCINPQHYEAEIDGTEKRGRCDDPSAGTDGAK